MKQEAQIVHGNPYGKKPRVKENDFIIHLNKEKTLMYDKVRIINLKGPCRGINLSPQYHN